MKALGALWSTLCIGICEAPRDFAKPLFCKGFMKPLGTLQTSLSIGAFHNPISWGLMKFLGALQSPFYIEVLWSPSMCKGHRGFMKPLLNSSFEKSSLCKDFMKPYRNRASHPSSIGALGSTPISVGKKDWNVHLHMCAYEVLRGFAKSSK